MNLINRHVMGAAVVAAVSLTGTHAFAQACATVVPNCKVTTATFNGNLGGLSGADAKCAAEFAGYRFARNPEFVYYAGTESNELTNSPQGWMVGVRVYSNQQQPSGAPQYYSLPSRLQPNVWHGTRTYNDCNNWTSSASITPISPAQPNPLQPGHPVDYEVHMGMAGMPINGGGRIWNISDTNANTQIINQADIQPIGATGNGDQTFCSNTHPLWCCNF